MTLARNIFSDINAYTAQLLPKNWKEIPRLSPWPIYKFPGPISTSVIFNIWIIKRKDNHKKKKTKKFPDYFTFPGFLPTFQSIESCIQIRYMHKDDTISRRNCFFKLYLSMRDQLAFMWNGSNIMFEIFCVIVWAWLFKYVGYGSTTHFWQQKISEHCSFGQYHYQMGGTPLIVVYQMGGMPLMVVYRIGGMPLMVVYQMGDMPLILACETGCISLICSISDEWYAPDASISDGSYGSDGSISDGWYVPDGSISDWWYAPDGSIWNGWYALTVEYEMPDMPWWYAPDGSIWDRWYINCFVVYEMGGMLLMVAYEMGGMPLMVAYEMGGISLICIRWVICPMVAYQMGDVPLMVIYQMYGLPLIVIVYQMGGVP